MASIGRMTQAEMKPLAEARARLNSHREIDWKKVYKPTGYRGHCQRCRAVLAIVPRGLMPEEAESYLQAGGIIAETLGRGNYSIVEGSALFERCWGG